MKKILLILCLLLFSSQSLANENVKNLSAEEALAKLKTGNKNYASLKMKHPDISKIRRDEMISGQHPFAVILACSDSRVPPEIVFDQGLGDIFVIRNAGNIVDKDVIGSIEYAVYHLGIKLIVVVGHENCGAVGAAMSEHNEAKYIEEILKEIEPSVEKCKRNNNFTYESVIKENVHHSVQQILTLDTTLADYIKTQDVKIVEAYEDLKTGKVTFK